ncbi:MAG: hypothetical protein ACN4GF_03035 [Lentimonas sp.]
MKLNCHNLSIGLTASALLFIGCGQQADDVSVSDLPVEITIPDAPDEAMEVILAELIDGNGGILWQAMPASYQGDINKVVQLAGTKIDAEMYDQTMAFLGRFGQVAGECKDYILNTALMGQMEATEKQQLEQAIPALVKVFEVITTSDVATSAGLQAFDGKRFFSSTVSELAKLSVELSTLDGSGQPTLQDLRDAEVTVVEQSETTATLQMLAAGESETTEMVKVENRWVPTDLAADWTKNMDEAIANMEAMSPEEMVAQKPQMLGVLTMLDGVLTQIEAAESQEQFDQAVQGAMMPIMGLMMMGQGMGGGAPAMPAAPMPTAP